MTHCATPIVVDAGTWVTSSRPVPTRGACTWTPSRSRRGALATNGRPAGGARERPGDRPGRGRAPPAVRARPRRARWRDGPPATSGPRARQQLEEAQRIAHVGSCRLDHASGTTTVSDEAAALFGLQPDDASFDFSALLEAVCPRPPGRGRGSAERRGFGGGGDVEVRIARRTDGALRRFHLRWDDVRTPREPGSYTRYPARRHGEARGRGRGTSAECGTRRTCG